ncbi:MAG: hypothetical protein L6300_02805 [Syntrophaceae bacterium]|nr:hypothetical protein [Pseudomonadota bacterium]MCG2739152.1 hypothetical protein [Syntrophaceae bacterium]
MPKRKKERVRFEIDPHNRLIIAETGAKAKVSRFRHIITGYFKIDKNNSLSYHVKAPTPQGARIPHQVKLQGNWFLTDDHNLQLTLNKWGRQTLGDKLTLQGKILDVRKNSLLFSVTTKTKENVQSTYILKLAGAWQADKHNRLTFRIKRGQGRDEFLTFKGGWELNKHHQIIYRYEKAQLIRKQKRIHTLTFKGYWDIKDKTRLYYVIDKRSDSVFAFKTSLGIFKDKYIKYKVGIGVLDKGKPSPRIITLYGTWKIKKGIGLTFEIEYENKKIHAIVFGADVKLTPKDKISFKLRNERNKEIGGELKLSHKILKGDGEAFLRFLKSKNETAVIVGAGFRW